MRKIANGSGFILGLEARCDEGVGQRGGGAAEGFVAGGWGWVMVGGVGVSMVWGDALI